MQIVENFVEKYHKLSKTSLTEFKNLFHRKEYNKMMSYTEEEKYQVGFFDSGRIG